MLLESMGQIVTEGTGARHGNISEVLTDAQGATSALLCWNEEWEVVAVAKECIVVEAGGFDDVLGFSRGVAVELSTMHANAGDLTVNELLEARLLISSGLQG